MPGVARTAFTSSSVMYVADVGRCALSTAGATTNDSAIARCMIIPRCDLLLPGSDHDAVAVLDVQIDKRHESATLVTPDRTRLRYRRNFPPGGQEDGVAKTLHRAVEGERPVHNRIS